MGRLEDRVAFVTGGARGMGRAIAEKLASEGADVITCDIGRAIEWLEYGLATGEQHETALLVEAHGRKCHAVVGDVRSQADLDRAVREGIDRFGKIDILVANAGIIDYKPFWEISDDEWGDILSVNLTGAWHSAKAVAPHMIERGSGCIVFNSSINGIEGGWNYAHYIAAKHGVLGLMKGVALELGEHGIRVNAVLPTVIDTPINDHQASWDRFAGHANATRDEWLASTRRFHLLRDQPALPPAAVADAVSWLVSDEARYVTGLQLLVDAGHAILPGTGADAVARGPVGRRADATPRTGVE